MKGLDGFRMGAKKATRVSDAKGGCCGKPTGCRIESEGCIHKIEKKTWQDRVDKEKDDV